ncbi:hypothetical protein Edno5_0037 [Edwardsiella phage Edno5]|uniref:Uncharacterized protein n=1 Tax=Edwardsiella phage Edno5 TaxID=2419942 RepID=A0A3G3BYF4_9CAUD|nr:hypothetical protein KE334_gp37 [Edwardsiella phage Edno5]AKM48227.1 hypothetical protein QY76_13690 [Edwardsiella sp. EA181011]AYP69245.1 hypothetical protein Edno5_0037 [Edwardsiella phage Edno5]RFT05475.1 hypothetical protein CGL57_00060 [Edwardsiella anguillarum]
MITIIDENNLVTEDGVELVSKKAEKCYECYFWENREVEDCTGLLCLSSERQDGIEVIFVEKNK